MEKVWALVSCGGPYTYIGKITEEVVERISDILESCGAVDLFDARQIQTIVIPTQNPLDPSKQMIGQENLVGPVALCAGGAHMRIKPKWVVLPDKETLAIIEKKYEMARRADTEDGARAAGIEPVHGHVNQDGYRR